jgi:hypothetical protein
MLVTMSLFQNKAVRLMVACSGEASLLDLAERQRNLLRVSLELYRALGGSFEEIERTLLQDVSADPRRVDRIVGDLMKELAAIGHIHDMDIMQAAHNTLDNDLRESHADFGDGECLVLV